MRRGIRRLNSYSYIHNIEGTGSAVSFVNCHFIKRKTWEIQFAIWFRMTKYDRSEKGQIFVCHLEFKSLSGVF